jgi:UDP-N-acetylglucosamine--dolichyl-phosphate N-acetylglucosaminephosphotransferase
MVALMVFSTNAINILAGVNGLEVGQSLVIGLSIMLNNCIQLVRLEGNQEDRRWNNLFSIYILLPFIGTSAALCYWNWYPSKVFVGDTYCYFAGVTFGEERVPHGYLIAMGWCLEVHAIFAVGVAGSDESLSLVYPLAHVAVAGILGHNPKTILIFMLPQILNFIFSCPQLFKLIPCPRHRMPGFVKETNEVCCSYVTFHPDDLSTAGRIIFRVCAALRLNSVETAADGTVTMSNFTLIAFTLYVCGPMKESHLTLRLLAFQCACTGFAFWVRYVLAGYIYNKVE